MEWGRGWGGEEWGRDCPLLYITSLMLSDEAAINIAATSEAHDGGVGWGWDGGKSDRHTPPSDENAHNDDVPSKKSFCHRRRRRLYLDLSVGRGGLTPLQSSPSLGREVRGAECGTFFTAFRWLISHA